MTPEEKLLFDAHIAALGSLAERVRMLEIAAGLAFGDPEEESDVLMARIAVRERIRFEEDNK